MIIQDRLVVDGNNNIGLDSVIIFSTMLHSQQHRHTQVKPATKDNFLKQFSHRNCIAFSEELVLVERVQEMQSAS